VGPPREGWPCPRWPPPGCFTAVRGCTTLGRGSTPPSSLSPASSTRRFISALSAASRSALSRDLTANARLAGTCNQEMNYQTFSASIFHHIFAALHPTLGESRTTIHSIQGSIREGNWNKGIRFLALFHISTGGQIRLRKGY